VICRFRVSVKSIPADFTPPVKEAIADRGNALFAGGEGGVRSARRWWETDQPA